MQISSFLFWQSSNYSALSAAGASSAGTLLTMYTDNVINYTMATLSYPCGFYGMMLGLIVGTKMKKDVV